MHHQSHDYKSADFNIKLCLCSYQYQEQPSAFDQAYLYHYSFRLLFFSLFLFLLLSFFVCLSSFCFLGGLAIPSKIGLPAPLECSPSADLRAVVDIRNLVPSVPSSCGIHGGRGGPAAT